MPWCGRTVRQLIAAYQLYPDSCCSKCVLGLFAANCRYRSFRYDRILVTDTFGDSSTSLLGALANRPVVNLYVSRIGVTVARGSVTVHDHGSV